MKYSDLKLFRIIKPIWYYSLPEIDKSFYLVDYNGLSNNQKSHFNYYNYYHDKRMELLDISYQGLNNGYVPSKNNQLIIPDNIFNITIIDEYKFVRRMFKSFWIYYALFIRIISFNNPYTELHAFFSTMNIRQIDFKALFFDNKKFKLFSSKLVKENPFISIIIPTLNRYEYIKNALHDLEKQHYKNFEVIIVDQSEKFNRLFYKQFNLDMVIVKQNEMQLWLARNKAIELSRSNFILFYEDDVRVNASWIYNHLKAIDYYNCDISTGILVKNSECAKEEKKNFHIASQFSSGNALVRKEIFNKVGLFDRQFEKMRMGDGEFGARCVKNGYLLVSNPESRCIDVKAREGGLRFFGQWDAFHSKRVFASKPVPSAIYFWKRYWGYKSAIYYLIQTLPLQCSQFKFKGSKFGYLQSILFFIIFSPFLIIKLLSSWIISSKMIKTGPQIKYIK